MTSLIPDPPVRGSSPPPIEPPPPDEAPADSTEVDGAVGSLGWVGEGPSIGEGLTDGEALGDGVGLDDGDGDGLADRDGLGDGDGLADCDGDGLGDGDGTASAVHVIPPGFSTSSTVAAATWILAVQMWSTVLAGVASRSTQAIPRLYEPSGICPVVQTFRSMSGMLMMTASFRFGACPRTGSFATENREFRNVPVPPEPVDAPTRLPVPLKASDDRASVSGTM